MIQFQASLFALSLLLSSTSAFSPGSVGCAKNLKTSLKPGGPSRHFNFDSNAGKDKSVNMKRRVRISLPPNYKEDVPAPVILAFHPKHRNGTSFETMTQFSNADLNPDAITVFPDGIDLTWTGDPFAPRLEQNNDITFTGELLDQISDNFCIDRSRIWAAGFDNGGGLVHLLACDSELSKRIAGFAMAAGTIYTDDAMQQKKACKQTLFDVDKCKPGRAEIPILQIHGDEDDLVSYKGHSFEGRTVPIPETMKEWVKKNGCDASKDPRKRLIVEKRVTEHTYDCGAEDAPLVLHYKLHGVGHEWPFVPSEEGVADSPGFDGTQSILDFFRKHPLPEELVPEINLKVELLRKEEEEKKAAEEKVKADEAAAVKAKVEAENKANKPPRRKEEL